MDVQLVDELFFQNRRTKKQIGIGNSDTDGMVTRYQCKKEVRDIPGFVVNIHDAINFDIDLQLPEELAKEYQSVISKKYTYLTNNPVGQGYLTNVPTAQGYLTQGYSHREDNYHPRESLAYRCRLQGIGIAQRYPTANSRGNQIISEVRKIIDRCDGWIICNLSDVDIYQRLLVDIKICLDGKLLDLKEHLLLRMDQEECPMFYKYINCKNKRYVRHRLRDREGKESEDRVCERVDRNYHQAGSALG